MMTVVEEQVRAADHIKYALGLLTEPGQIVELRIPKAGGRKRTDSGYFDNPQDLAAAAQRYNGRDTAYVTLNPVNPDLLARAANRMREYADTTTSDADIARRLWLPVDVDPIRPADISSTEEEHSAALARVGEIVAWLATDLGWPAPITSDSGNGGHALYRVDLPNDSESAALVAQCLDALALIWDDDGLTVDTTTFNASRIWKLYGTKACKGDDIPSRPHRYAHILTAPESLQVVTVDQLRQLAAMAPKEEPRAAGYTNGNGAGFDLEGWLAQHGLTGHKKSWKSGALWQLDKCPFSDAHSDGAFVGQQASGALFAGCKHNSCAGKGWADLRALFEDPEPTIIWPNANQSAGPSKNGNGAAKKPTTRKRAQANPEKMTAALGTEEEDNFLLTAGLHDEGNAQCVYRLHGAEVAYCEALGWLSYTGTYWSAKQGESAVRRAIVDTLKRRSVAAIAETNLALLNAAKPSAGRVRDAKYLFERLVTVPVSDFDREPFLLNVANGVVDLRTGELAAHEPGNRFSYCVPVNYVPGAWDGLYHRLMLQWLDGDAERVSYVQRALGYSMTGEDREECMFYLQGAGRSGKGTMLNTVKESLGGTVAMGTEFALFTDRRNDPQNFRLAPLRNARLVVASESNKTQKLDAAIIKQLTGGGDGIQASFKHQTPFDFVPRFKIWLMSNYLPKGDTDDDAFWWRVRLIQLTKSYMEAPDLSLKEQLRTRTEQESMLSWLVWGAMQWYSKGLGRPSWQRDALQRTRAELDPLQRFLEDASEREPRTHTDLNDLHEAYIQWCADEGIEPLAKNTVSGRLSGKGYSVLRERVRVDGKQRKRVVVENVKLIW